MSGEDVDTKVDETKDDANREGDASKDDKDAGKDTKTDGDKGNDELANLKKALASERKLRTSAEKTLRDKELEALPEIDRLKTENQSLTQTTEKLTRENIKLTIALELELPWRIAKRITGDTEDDMRSDAADLLADFKARTENGDRSKTPPNDGARRGKDGAKSVNMNDLLRAAAGKS